MALASGEKLDQTRPAEKKRVDNRQSLANILHVYFVGKLFAAARPFNCTCSTYLISQYILLVSKYTIFIKLN